MDTRRRTVEDCIPKRDTEGRARLGCYSAGDHVIVRWGTDEYRGRLRLAPDRWSLDIDGGGVMSPIVEWEVVGTYVPAPALVE